MMYTFSNAMQDIERGRGGRKKLANQTYLYKVSEEKFVVELYSTKVVEIYPEYQVLSVGNWPSQTTCKVINTFSATYSVGPNSRLGYKDRMRIGKYPFFNGIRIDNRGEVFPEDIRSDWKRTVKPEAVRAWKALHMPITKALRGRFEIGEFDGVYLARHYDDVLPVLEGMDRNFPDHDEVCRMLRSVEGRTWNKEDSTVRDRTPEERWKDAINRLRPVYYAQHDGYMDVEVKNV